MKQNALRAHMIRGLSVLAQCDPRTVIKVIEGGNARGSVEARIKMVMEDVRPFDDGADRRLRDALDREATYTVNPEEPKDRREKATSIWSALLSDMLDVVCKEEPYTRDELLSGLKKAAEEMT